MGKEDEEDNMFEAAVSKFTEAVGAESNLIPVPDLDSAGDCRPLQVVIKKNKKWFWQSPRYEPAKDISLNELLTDTKPFTGVKQETNKLVTYNKTHKFSIQGKVGAKLKSVLDIEAQGSDYVAVEAKFGDVEKVEADQYELMKALESRNLDLNNDYLKQVRQHKRKVLCVVVGTAKLTKDGTLTADTKVTGGESLEEGETVAKVVPVSADESASTTDESSKSFKIPAGTPLAYNICEVLVHRDGTLDLIIDRDCKGGFEDESGGTTMCSIGLGHGDVTDGPGYRDIQASCILEALRGLDAATRRELTIGILTMCTYPHDVDATLNLLKEAYRLAKKSETKSVQAEEIRKSFISTQGCCQPVLEQAGFTFMMGSVSYPKHITPKLEAMRYLFEALVELGEDALIALGQLDEEYVKPVQNLLSYTIHGNHYCTTDVEVSAIYKGDNSGRHLVDSLGFTVDTITQKIMPSGGSLCRLYAAFRALFALWHEIQDIESKGNCILL